MANKIQVKRSAVPAKVPTTSDLDLGEIAINTYDGIAYIKKDNGTASIVQLGGGSGSGDVVGPSSATDNALTRFDTTTGKLIQNSVGILDDSGNLSGILSQTFSNGSAVTVSAGKMWYNGSNGSWNLGMGGGSVTQQVGEELYRYGKASSAITDSPLQLVYKTGVVGASGEITFAPAVAGITDSDQIIGCATENIALNSFGRVTTYGVIHNITTNGTAYGETWADNDDIYYNPTTGGLTKTLPSAPGLKVLIGTVINAGSGGSGSFIVKLGVGTYLSRLSDIQLASLSGGQLLTYNATGGYWKNTSLSAGTGISVATTAGGEVTITNSAPDQTVAISGTSPVSVTGTYPTFTVSMTQSSGSVNGWLSSTDWTTFNGKQTAYTNLSTIGALANGTGWLYNNGTGTFSYSTPTAADVGAVPTARTITINGTSFDLSANRTWSVGTVTSVAALTLGTTGTDLSSTVATGTTTPVITLNVPTASATNRGALSAADWTTFNSKGNGTVTSVGGTGTVSGLTLTGTVTGSGNLTLGGNLSITADMIYDTFTATASQTTFTTSQTYTSGKISVYVNGVKFRNGSDCTVTSGTSVVMATGLTVGDLVDLVYPI